MQIYEINSHNISVCQFVILLTIYQTSALLQVEDFDMTEEDQLIVYDGETPAAAVLAVYVYKSCFLNVFQLIY